MPKQKWKRPNAYKHGVFSATAIFPGEDEQEFEELHAALVEEWMPVGATEEDAFSALRRPYGVSVESRNSFRHSLWDTLAILVMALTMKSSGFMPLPPS